MNDLLKLAALLDTVSASKFDLGSWHRPASPFVSECNTTACAIGWACMSKQFPGLSLGKPDEVGLSTPLWHSAQKLELAEGWEAVSGYFNISATIALWLFSQPSYEPGHIAPAHVANRIREYCKAPAKFDNVTLYHLRRNLDAVRTYQA